MIPPLDLFSEIFGGKDHTNWNFALKPATTQPVDPGALVARGVELRKELRSSEHTKPASMPSTRRWRASTTQASRPNP